MLPKLLERVGSIVGCSRGRKEGSNAIPRGALLPGMGGVFYLLATVAVLRGSGELASSFCDDIGSGHSPPF